MAKQQLTPKSQDMSKWYTQVIQQAELADYSPVKGSMVFRPNGFAIWEAIQKAFDPMMAKMRVRNSYFPLFIPMSLLEREADHIEGFAPELAVVTIGGGEELAEKLAVRPTSETIMYEMYSKWVQSHRDLPLNLNQWNNVVRWEKRTYFFLRTLEFLWQEAHTAHATHKESWQIVLDFVHAYRDLAQDLLAIPVVVGKKSKSERFAGADETTTIESMMPDGKALQSATSHDLGQNFSKSEAFDISFQDKNGETQYAWQGSHGLSTRIIGGLIMTHGDDDGLILPPKVAATKAVIIPVFKKGSEDAVRDYCHMLLEQLNDAQSSYPGHVEFWDDESQSYGYKRNDADVRGIPLVLTVGPQEADDHNVSIAYRLKNYQGLESRTTPAADVSIAVEEMLETFQQVLFERAQAKTAELTSETDSYDEFKSIMAGKRGYIKAFWCEDEACETSIKDETKATTRCLPFTDEQGSVAEESGNCIYCNKPATHRWLFAQAY